MTKIKLDRQVTSFIKEGEAQPFEEAEKEFEDRPEQWKSILANGLEGFCIEGAIPAIKQAANIL